MSNCNHYRSKYTYSLDEFAYIKDPEEYLHRAKCDLMENMLNTIDTEQGFYCKFTLLPFKGADKSKNDEFLSAKELLQLSFDNSEVLVLDCYVENLR